MSSATNFAWRFKSYMMSKGSVDPILVNTLYPLPASYTRSRYQLNLMINFIMRYKKRKDKRTREMMIIPHNYHVMGR